MNCNDLAWTGGDFPRLVGLAVLAAALLVLGIVLRKRARPGRRIFGVILIFCIASLLTLAPTTGAQAECAAPTPTPTPTQTNSLTILQTSTNTGLSPTEAPSMLTGRVVNNGPDDTFVTAVIVSIESVVKAPGARPGNCDASDYLLIGPRMPVQEHLAADGGSATFSGARIGFLADATNQDACKGAIVELRYITG